MEKNMKLITNIVPLAIFIVGAIVAIAWCVSQRDHAMQNAKATDHMHRITTHGASNEDKFRDNPPIIDDTITMGEAAISSNLDFLENHAFWTRYSVSTIEWTLCAWFSLWCVQQIALYVRLQFSFQVRK